MKKKKYKPKSNAFKTIDKPPHRVYENFHESLEVSKYVPISHTYNDDMLENVKINQKMCGLVVKVLKELCFS